MTDDAAANWAYSEAFIPEDDVLLAARDDAAELGCVPIFPGGGAALTVLAAGINASSVCEIGTGAGVSAIYLLRGMAPEGILTTIDIEPENQKVAKAHVEAAGFAAARVRTIAGAALEVLPRMTDDGYDMVFVDAVKREYPQYVEHAVRMLRPGGILAVDNMLWHSKVADPAQRDENTTFIRETLKQVRSDERLQSVLLPSGDGLLVAAKRR
jgi:predicted O-methyltransferase YrrM